MLPLTQVMRLLSCMKTLGDENAALIKQVEEGTRVRQENEKLKREMAEFKELYASRVSNCALQQRLSAVLNDICVCML